MGHSADMALACVCVCECGICKVKVYKRGYLNLGCNFDADYHFKPLSSQVSSLATLLYVVKVPRGN